MHQDEFGLTWWAVMLTERSCFLVPNSCWRLSRLVWPLQTRGEPVPEDEDRGWPGPSAFCPGETSLSRMSYNIVKTFKNRNRKCELPFYRSLRRHQLRIFLLSVWCFIIPLETKIPTPRPPRWPSLRLGRSLTLHADWEHVSLECLCSFLVRKAMNAEVSLSEHRVSRFPSSAPSRGTLCKHLLGLMYGNGKKFHRSV